MTEPPGPPGQPAPSRTGFRFGMVIGVMIGLAIVAFFFWLGFRLFF